MTALHDFARRYIAVWNEPDAEHRRAQIAALWREDGTHFTPSMEARGHAALEARIAGAYARWVATGLYVFRSTGDANGHHGGVRFHWQMVAIADQTIHGAGFDFVVLDDDGRIVSDHQFVDPTPAR